MIKDFYIARPDSARQALEITFNQLKNVKTNNALSRAEKNELVNKLENRVRMISLVLQQQKE